MAGGKDRSGEISRGVSFSSISNGRARDPERYTLLFDFFQRRTCVIFVLPSELSQTSTCAR